MVLTAKTVEDIFARICFRFDVVNDHAFVWLQAWSARDDAELFLPVQTQGKERTTVLALNTVSRRIITPQSISTFRFQSSDGIRE